ncbi:MAG: aminomethyl-transferring glycine dehydrogenase subunit GcvPA [Planctomycetes bacterium]|nr:aminomethyl-transferring glycine dehydrogenase subunit GcvPA [Planctomycetota bacterium]
MPYILNTIEDQREMLRAIGASSIDELFECIPPEYRLNRPLAIPPAMSEMELARHMAELAALNRNASNSICFLGGGSYDHFVPAAIDALVGRGEFYTSYTPYQPEVSQGNLQAMFEYQTAVCALTGLDVSNASLYDGGSAATEAVLMAMSATSRPNRVVAAESAHPEYRRILRTYFAALGAELVVVPAPGGTVDPADWERAIDDRTACALVQSPNFFGCVEDVASVASIAHARGALCVQAFDPISLGLLKRPGELGADIAVAEGQSLGTPLLFGGPYLGVMACREPFVRRLPGRIAGQTVDRRGRTCWVLTLQTREQHIRREKATSNICTNQGLFALRALIYLALAGRNGLRDIAALCLRKSRYALDRIRSDARFRPAFERPFFKEFVVRDGEGRVAELLAAAESDGVLAGLPLGRWYPELDDCFLVCVTEKRTRPEIDRLAFALQRHSEHSGAAARHA